MDLSIAKTLLKSLRTSGYEEYFSITYELDLHSGKEEVTDRWVLWDGVIHYFSEYKDLEKYVIERYLSESLN
jgi:hypothetical protein